MFMTFKFKISGMVRWRTVRAQKHEDAVKKIRTFAKFEGIPIRRGPGAIEIYPA